MNKKNINYRLGLDLDTNSIGWSVCSLDDDNKIDTLVDMGVRIFSNSCNPKSGEPLAVERRLARGMRRALHRRKMRRREMSQLLHEYGLPFTPICGKHQKPLNTLALRVKALYERLELEELDRVLFNLSVRRGFKSNRKDRSDAKKDSTSDSASQSDKTSQAKMITSLSEAIKSSGNRTLGEWLFRTRSKDGIRFVPGRIPFYPSRAMYEEEFAAIKAKQQEYYPNVDWTAIHMRYSTNGHCAR